MLKNLFGIFSFPLSPSFRPLSQAIKTYEFSLSSVETRVERTLVVFFLSLRSSAEGSDVNPMSPRGKEREEENGGRRKRKRKEIGALLVLLVFPGPRRSSKFLLSHAMQQCVQKCSSVDFFSSLWYAIPKRKLAAPIFASKREKMRRNNHALLLLLLHSRKRKGRKKVCRGILRIQNLEKRKEE